MSRNVRRSVRNKAILAIFLVPAKEDQSEVSRKAFVAGFPCAQMISGVTAWLKQHVDLDDDGDRVAQEHFDYGHPRDASCAMKGERCTCDVMVRRNVLLGAVVEARRVRSVEGRISLPAFTTAALVHSPSLSPRIRAARCAFLNQRTQRVESRAGTQSSMRIFWPSGVVEPPVVGDVTDRH